MNFYSSHLLRHHSSWPLDFRRQTRWRRVPLRVWLCAEMRTMLFWQTRLQLSALLSVRLFLLAAEMSSGFAVSRCLECSFKFKWPNNKIPNSCPSVPLGFFLMAGTWDFTIAWWQKWFRWMLSKHLSFKIIYFVRQLLAWCRSGLLLDNR